jgi:hypothetical protein
MLLSLAVVLVVIAPLWLIIPHHTKQHVTVVDYQPVLAGSRRASAAPLLSPVGLPSSWRATSVSSTGGNGRPLRFHLGFLTPHSQYAAVEQSDGAAAALVTSLEGKSPKVLPPVRVGSLTWQQLRGADGRLALVAPPGRTAVVVTGTAGLPELTTLAASLR